MSELTEAIDSIDSYVEQYVCDITDIIESHEEEINEVVEKQKAKLDKIMEEINDNAEEYQTNTEPLLQLLEEYPETLLNHNNKTVDKILKFNTDMRKYVSDTSEAFLTNLRKDISELAKKVKEMEERFVKIRDLAEI